MILIGKRENTHVKKAGTVEHITKIQINITSDKHYHWDSVILQVLQV